MKKYIFSEKNFVEEILNTKSIDDKNPTNTIRALARYNYYVLGYGKDRNYKEIVSFMNENCPEFSEYSYQFDIIGCIKDVKKMPWRDIESVDITESEIEFIKSLNDIKKQKIAFVLLCTAKYRDLYNLDNEHKTNISSSDLYKMARVVLPKNERVLFLHFLVEDGLVEKHNYAKTNNKKLLFASDDANDKVVLKLHEIDFLELAYVYLDYINNHDGYSRCEKCGRVIKQSKTKPRKYCPECAELLYVPINFRIVKCIDCGKEFEVSSKDTATCRCQECQSKHRYDPIETKTVKCIDCGKEFEIPAKDTQTIRCSECQTRHRYKPIEVKIIKCVDCGKEFEVSAKDTQTIRCSECRNEFIKKYDRERKRIARCK